MESESNPQNLILSIHGERFPVDSKILQVSLFLKMLTEMFPNQEIPIDDKKINIPIMKKIVEYCEMHDYDPPKIAKPLKSGNLKEVLCEKDYNFIKNVNYEEGDEMQTYIEAAIYFQMQTLQDVCICRMAIDYYSGDEQEGFENLKKKLKIEDDISLAEEHRIKIENPWIDK